MGAWKKNIRITDKEVQKKKNRTPSSFLPPARMVERAREKKKHGGLPRLWGKGKLGTAHDES